MKILSYQEFLNEAIASGATVTKKIKVSFDIDWNKNIGKVEDEFVLAMSPDSSGVYSVGEDVEKYCGIPEADVIRDIKAGKESPQDALIYGLCNIANGGKDIYFWTNGTRLSGASKQNGIWAACFEQVSHECIHLTRLILTRAIAKKKGVKIENGDWIEYNYGDGKLKWPSVGDDEKTNLIDEEAFATAVGLVVQQVTPHFLDMAAAYIPELSLSTKN
jgi:hypothetical protein